MPTPPACSQDATVPEPLAPRRAWRDAVGYLGVVFATLVSLFVSQEMWKADLKVPLFGVGDSLLSQLFVKNVMESGSYHQGHRVGAPGEQVLFDFPMSDTLHFFVIRLIACFTSDYALVFNLFVLLPFPLIALSTYFVSRRLGMGRPESVVAGALFACAPFHFLRTGHHIFLACYYLVPLMIWIVLRIHEGWDPFREKHFEGAVRSGLLSWGTLGVVLVSVLTGLAGVYYAFFSCFLILAVGVRGAFQERRWGRLLLPALLIGCVAASLLAGLSPAIAHRLREGKNPGVANRSPIEAEIYGLKPNEMLLPVYGHRHPSMRMLQTEWFSLGRPRTASWPQVPLGIVGSIGFLFLIGRLLGWRAAGAGRQAADGLAYLNLVALILASVGGFGALFAYFVSPMIRCYDRMSIFIAFFSIAALFLAISSVGRAARGWGRAAYLAVLSAILLVGMYDQTAGPLREPYPVLALKHASDRDFGRRMEAALSPGAMVYQMPYMLFPEVGLTHQLDGYEQLRPYFHTRTLRWSHAAMRGRDTSNWLEAVSKLPLPESLERLAIAGFDGVHLDRRGYEDRGAKAEAELSRLLGTEPLVSRNGLQTFFDMTQYAKDVRARLGERTQEPRGAVQAPPQVPSPTRRQ